VQLDLRDGGYNYDHHGYTCMRDERSSGMGINGRSPRRYHTMIDPLLNIAHIRRIRTLDVLLHLPDGLAEGDPGGDFWHALDGFKLFTSPPWKAQLLRKLRPRRQSPPELATSLFGWRAFQPTELRHLTLYGWPGSGCT